MTIESPERLDLHRTGQEAKALTLVAAEEAVRFAENVVVRLWDALSDADRERARPVRDAVKVILIVHVSQDPEHEHWVQESVRGLLEPRISHQADRWWEQVLDGTVLAHAKIEASVEGETAAEAAKRRILESTEKARAGGVSATAVLREMRSRDRQLGKRYAPVKDTKASRERQEEFRKAVGL
ncbi:hypothetical protein [Kitasatospora azatica]|uniref:hypothetical protein n=1 Tax=Kitasatospora azatica TaxID=58347 RepID=UPI0005673376|nr:hypothetical protein [Kitasatospora azatica]